MKKKAISEMLMLMVAMIATTKDDKTAIFTTPQMPAWHEAEK